MNPHFWRTHDGGKTWTEIDNGIAPGAVANSIREDPRKKGLLYASTDTQVWVSFDDGDHWQSLRLDMPAISVRDIQVKDDSTCHVLRSRRRHARPRLLDSRRRHAAAADRPRLQRRAVGAARRISFKPATGGARALRDERSHAVAARGAGRRESAAGRADRLLSRRQRVGPGDARDSRRSAARSCAPTRATTALRGRRSGDRSGGATTSSASRRRSLPDCGLPLYWPAPPMSVSTQAGMHRFSWDMRFDPVSDAGGGRRRIEGRRAAPHLLGGERAVGAAGQLHGAPDGRRQELHAADHAAARSAREDAGGGAGRSWRRCHASCTTAQSRRTPRICRRAALARSSTRPPGDDVAAFKAALDSLAPPPPAGGRGRGGFGGGGGTRWRAAGRPAHAGRREQRDARRRNGDAGRGRRANGERSGERREGAGAERRSDGAVEPAQDERAFGAERETESRGGGADRHSVTPTGLGELPSLNALTVQKPRKVRRRAASFRHGRRCRAFRSRRRHRRPRRHRGRCR